MAVVEKHYLLHGSWQLYSSTACCIFHGSYAEALAPTWFMSAVSDLYGQSGLGMICVTLNRMCVQVWNLNSMQTVLHLMSSSCSSCKLDKNLNVACVIFVLHNLS